MAWPPGAYYTEGRDVVFVRQHVMELPKGYLGASHDFYLIHLGPRLRRLLWLSLEEQDYIFICCTWRMFIGCRIYLFYFKVV
jgi:hypothetical protein